MAHVHITVTLDPAAFGLPSHPDVPNPTFEFALDHAGEDMDVAETVFALCNSYPGEMHAPDTEANRAIVAAYRARSLRSLSVGDTVEIDRDGKARRYRVASFGFDAE